MKRGKCKKLAAVLTAVSLAIVGVIGIASTISAADAGQDEAREMVVAVPNVPDTADCQNTANATVRQAMSQQLYDFLMKKDTDGSTVNNLLVSSSWKEDASEMTCELMKGIKFWNGAEMTSEDIAYTFERAKTCNGSVKSYCADVDHVEIIDDYNFKIIMATPNVALQEYLCCIPIINKEFTEACGDSYGTDVDKVMGSGPYKLVEWKFGESMRYEAFEDYVFGEAPVKKILIEPISDPNAAAVALQTGEVDLYMNDMSYVYLEDIKNAGNVTVDEYPSTKFSYVVMNSETGLFTDINLRKAVAYAVNRTEMEILGLEDPENGYLINSPAGPDFICNPTYEGWPYEQDIEKAIELVKESGHYGDKILVSANTTDPYLKLAAKLMDNLTAIGFECDIEQLDNTGFVSKVCSQGDFEIGITFNNFPGRDMAMAIDPQLASNRAGAAGNYGRYKDEHMDELIIKCKAITDPEARTEAYRELIDYYAEQVPTVPLYYGVGNRCFTNDLTVVENSARYDRLYYYSWK